MTKWCRITGYVFAEKPVEEASEKVAISPRQKDKLSPSAETKTYTMIYTTSTLKSVAECDVILEELAASSRTIEARNSLLLEGVNNQSAEAEDLPAEIASLTASIADLNQQIAAEQDMKKLNKLTIERNALDSDRARLSNRELSLVGQKLTDKQFSMSINVAKLVAIAEYRTAVEARKTELQNASAAA